MSVASEITRLQNAKADIKTAIEAKGVTIPSNATLDEFDSYIEDIPSGGGTPETLEELNSIINSYFQKYVDLSKDYETYTTDNITLYTPDADYENYVISKDNSNKYRINWINTTEILAGLNATTFGIFSISLPTSAVKDVNNVRLNVGASFTTYYRSSSTYSSINECILAIQSSTTSYTKRTTQVIPANDVGEYIIPYSNASIIGTDLSTPLSSQKISSNETIEVISSE